jgi:hypothetical protein
VSSVNATVMVVAMTLAWTASTTRSYENQDNRRVERLENEKKKLERTKNPEARAESLMRIAEITLTFVSDAANAGEPQRMLDALDQYRRAVRDTRDTMMESGLDPHKKSKGYRVVEMSLRRQLRYLNDIAKNLTVDERQPVEETIRLVSTIREEFIQKLFGRTNR